MKYNLYYLSLTAFNRSPRSDIEMAKRNVLQMVSDKAGLLKFVLTADACWFNASNKCSMASLFKINSFIHN